jgi:Fe-S cluster assembly protein SufD
MAISAFSPAAAGALAGPRWLQAEREEAAERFASSSLPTAALEEWRYSRIDALDLERYASAPSPAGAAPAPPEAVRGLIGALGNGVAVVETRDGYLAGARAADRSVSLDRLSAPDAKRAGLGALAGEPDALVTLNRAFAPVPLRLRVAPGSAPKPIVVVHRVDGAGLDGKGVAVFPRLLVEIGEQAQVAVLELLVGEGDALLVPVSELEVGAGASLSWVQVQLLSSEVWQVALQASRVARDATLSSAAVALGGSYARLRTDSVLDGPAAAGRLLAVYLASGGQMHDLRTTQHHRGARTTSDLFYKGAVANTARSVYSGLIKVEKGARGTDAMQTNRNLVLHQGAHADSVPNLEIEENDVRCSHASAVGPIPDDQRFYLASRGVPPAAADRLISLGFLDEALGRLPISGVAGSLRSLMQAKLIEAEEAEAAEVVA